MTVLRQSTARTVLVGPVLDSTGAAKTDEVVANIKLTKNGTVGAANGSATLTHDHAGKYLLALTTSDTDTVGVLEVSLSSGTNDMPVARFNVVEEVVFDAVYAASAALAVGSVTGNVGGNVVGSVGSVSGDTKQTADVATLIATIGVAGAGLTALAPAATALSNVIWTDAKAGYLDAAISSRSTYSGTDTAGTTTLLSRIVGTLAAGTHNAQSGDAHAYLTTNLGLLGANATALASATNLATVAGYLDTEIQTIIGYVDCLPATLDGSTLTALGDARIANLDATVGSRSSHSASAVAALVLATPANKILTDANGYVTFSNASIPVDGTVQLNAATGWGGAALPTSFAVSDKTGFSLSAAGLDAVATTPPSGPASNFREMVVQVWRRFFKRATKTSTTLVTYADNGTTPITTQLVSDDDTTETQGASF